MALRKKISAPCTCMIVHGVLSLIILHVLFSWEKSLRWMFSIYNFKLQYAAIEGMSHNNHNDYACIYTGTM